MNDFSLLFMYRIVNPIIKKKLQYFYPLISFYGQFFMYNHNSIC